MRKWFFRDASPLRIVSNKSLESWRPSPRFYDQLHVELKKLGYNVRDDFKKPADVAIVIESSSRVEKLVRMKEKGTKIVQRIDGIRGNPGGLIAEHPKNKDMADVYAVADGVIFQSEFCKKVWERHFKPVRPEVKNFIVMNGANERFFSRKGPKYDGFGSKRLIVTAARWRKWKNLEQMVEVIDRLDRDDCILVVAGRLELIEPIKHPRVKYLENLSHIDLGALFRSADMFLYLAWFEWCPKVVAQALFAGLPVICSSRGGTKEMVQDCGIAVPSLDEDNLDDFDTPIGVDVDAAVDAVKNILEHRKKYIRPRPDMMNSFCAIQYLQAFYEVVQAD